jgi:hypothetical protein
MAERVSACWKNDVLFVRLFACSIVTFRVYERQVLHHADLALDCQVCRALVNEVPGGIKVLQNLAEVVGLDSDLADAAFSLIIDRRHGE